MDWNNDGKFDFQDSTLYHMEISEKSSDNTDSGSSGGGHFSGNSNEGLGCVVWILITVLAIQVINWISKIF